MTDESNESGTLQPEAQLPDGKREWSLVRVGTAEILIGMLSSATAVLLHEEAYVWLATFFSHVGVGLMGVGLLTATVEALTHKRNREYLARTQRWNRLHLKKLQDTTAVTLLKQFIPEDVFLEVQNQLISKPFSRRDFRIFLAFDWVDAQRERLTLHTSVEFTLRNTSSSPQVFPFAAVETWHEDGNEVTVNITHAYVMRDGEDPRSLTNLAAEGSPNKTRETHRVIVQEPIPLRSEESVGVRWNSVRTHFERDHTSIALTLATKGLMLKVHHPEDLRLDLAIQHPSAKSFREIPGPAGERQWEFEGGFLPYQGVKLSWRKMPARIQAPPIAAVGGSLQPT